jgi:hypothetical protein
VRHDAGAIHTVSLEWDNYMKVILSFAFLVLTASTPAQSQPKSGQLAVAVRALPWSRLPRHSGTDDPAHAEGDRHSGKVNTLVYQALNQLNQSK